MAEQLTETGVTVNAMHPGGVKTNIGMNNGFIYRFYQNFVLSPFLSSPEISGEAIYYLVADPEMAKFSGKFFNQTIEEKAARYALDRVMGKKVWEISEKLTGLDNQEK
jgi:NAD(P)-dependent dehydrogenase (short-subunit alcohol dehydrogenase family)